MQVAEEQSLNVNVDNLGANNTKPTTKKTVKLGWTKINKKWYYVTAKGNKTGWAKIDGNIYYFNNSGVMVTGFKEINDKVFYFAKNMFVSSGDLSGDYQYAIILPFRAFYASEYTGDPGAKLTNFRVIFGDKEDDNSTTGISELKDVDLAVIPGKGIITLMARAEKDVTIHAVSGITVDKCNLKAGEARTVAVPAGVYVINGVKMVVK